MNRVYQTKTVVVNKNGVTVQRGNCMAAAIASIMEIPITEVPNIEVLYDVDNTFWFEVLHTWLNSKGWELTTISQADALKESGYYLVSGKSARGVSHVCIYKNGELIHDPHISGDGLETIETFQILERV